MGIFTRLSFEKPEGTILDAYTELARNFVEKKNKYRFDRRHFTDL